MTTDFGTVPPAAPRSTGTNVLAIVSLVLSAVGLCIICCWPVAIPLGIIGVILGSIARKQIRTRGDQGDTVAIIGMVLGAVVTCIGIGLAVLGAMGHLADQNQWFGPMPGMEAPEDPADDMEIDLGEPADSADDLGDSADSVPADAETPAEETPAPQPE
jgi:Domain of unknown function (DUF4190)